MQAKEEKMTEYTGDEAAPELKSIFPPLVELLAEHRPAVLRHAERQYGKQLGERGDALSLHLRRYLPAANPVRWWEMNQSVTSRVTPRGTSSGFDPESHRFRQQVNGATAAMERVGKYELGCVLAKVSMPVKDALLRATTLAARIRGTQTLLDGNHRTSLMAMVVSLAECDVTLRPEFSLYTAYIILSCREHPGNIGNMLSDQAMADAAARLFKYSRRRVRPATPDWPYLEDWGERIRRLPVYNAMIEAEYRRLRLRTAVFDGGEEMQDLDEQMREWHKMPSEIRRHIALAYPKFQPGASM